LPGKHLPHEFQPSFELWLHHLVRALRGQQSDLDSG
jgi:hypothetical protein